MHQIQHDVLFFGGFSNKWLMTTLDSERTWLSSSGEMEASMLVFRLVQTEHSYFESDISEI